jgi:hypothetical protein
MGLEMDEMSLIWLALVTCKAILVSHPERLDPKFEFQLKLLTEKTFSLSAINLFLTFSNEAQFFMRLYCKLNKLPFSPNSVHGKTRNCFFTFSIPNFPRKMHVIRTLGFSTQSGKPTHFIPFWPVLLWLECILGVHTSSFAIPPFLFKFGFEK